MQKISPTKLFETYLALAVHDLKTPVNAQILATEYLLKYGNMNNDSSEMINDILDSARYLKDLIDNILTKYQIETSAINLRVEKNSLIDVANDAISCVKYLLEEKNIKLEFNHKLKDLFYDFDYIEIRRVISNILTNAVEYSPRNNKIILTIEENKNNMKISIADFGNGIDLQNPADIFEKDLTLAKAQKKLGTGLGLFISKQIVEAHHGEIGVKTKINKGTTISFSLPKHL